MVADALTCPLDAVELDSKRALESAEAETPAWLALETFICVRRGYCIRTCQRSMRFHLGGDTLQKQGTTARANTL
jgi:hypothetical protein